MDIKGMSFYVNPNNRTLTTDIKNTVVSDKSMYATLSNKLIPSCLKLMVSPSIVFSIMLTPVVTIAPNAAAATIDAPPVKGERSKHRLGF